MMDSLSKQRYVFVLDDDQASRESVVALVEPMNVTIQAFEKANEFLEAYHGQRPAVLVSDQRMPGLSGIQLLEQLRQRDIQLAVVIMTAYPDTRSTVTAMKHGAITLLEKPCNPQELWDAVCLALETDEINYREEQEKRLAQQQIDSLSQGEQDVLRLLATGITNKVVANRLGISLRTVEGRRASIFDKLAVKSLAEMMVVWINANE